MRAKVHNIQNITINQEGLRDNTNKLDHHRQLLPAEYPSLPPSGNLRKQHNIVHLKSLVQQLDNINRIKLEYRECLLLLPTLISAPVGYVGVKAGFS